MKVLITGASGTVGQALIKELLQRGSYEISVLTRRPDFFNRNFSIPIEAYHWNPNSMTIDQKAFENVDAIINLAGENVADGRWSKDRKEKILKSRVNSTKLLVEGVKKITSKPKVFISASAVGVYGQTGNETHTEKDQHTDNSFLSQVCQQWENELISNHIDSIRKVIVRIGVVLSAEGGALSKMLPAFRACIGGKLGSGKQYMSWIHSKDLARIFIHILENENIEGIVNGVSPEPVTNLEFTKTLGKVLKRPTVFPVPSFVLNLALGELSEMLLGGQKVFPQVLKDSQFKFEFSHLVNALNDLLSPLIEGTNSLESYQYIPKNNSEVFQFFSNENNLEKITPPYLNFKVLSKSTHQINEGTIIDYQLKLYGIPLKWKSLISEWCPNQHFVDTQEVGPYKMWHHSHHFYPYLNGTIVHDKINYSLPGGRTGRFLFHWFVKRDLDKIFKYRKIQIKKIIA